MLEGASFILCLAGMALFLLALLNGFAIPVLKSPRLGLSAHLAGVQSGTFLIVVGLLWGHVAIWPSWSMPLAYGIAGALAALWLALLLAGVFGAGHGLPIAGQGVTTTPLRQRAVTLLLAAGSLGALVSVAALLAAMILET
jgi:hydroxylaminobenzene mutase